MSAFVLHPRLAADCAAVCELPLCRVLLMDDSRWPWCILVPRRVGLSELHQLEGAEREMLWQESATLSRALRELAAPCERLNVAALGNLVVQLHLHHVARRVGDANWPGPVWGFGQREPYAAADREARVEALRDALGASTAAPG